MQGMRSLDVSRSTVRQARWGPIVLGRLAHHGITTVFDHVFSSAELGVGKPVPQAFRVGAHQLGVAPHRIFSPMVNRPTSPAPDAPACVPTASPGQSDSPHDLTMSGIPVTVRPAVGPA